MYTMLKIINFYMLILLCLVGQMLRAQEKKDPLSYVNTLQGTYSNPQLSYGNTYPTIALPFAQNFFSAQTGKNGDGWKYKYTDSTIRGFQQVHQCSPWMNDYAVFSLMPVTGQLKVLEDDRASAFNHDQEIGKPNYYRVKFYNGIQTEISPTERGAFMRFSFPKKTEAHLVLDGYTKGAQIEVQPEKRRVIGRVRNGYFMPNKMWSHFVIEFDQDFTTSGTWSVANPTPNSGQRTIEGEQVGAYITFKKGAIVNAKVASSYIDIEQAELNLSRELGTHKNLEQARKAGADVWNALLGRIEIEGGTEEEKATFYSCLFRANLFSRKIYEINKENKPIYFSPYDEKVHDGYMYTDNGFWDTFRAQFPLNNIFQREYQGRYMQSLLDAYDQSGWLPTWSNPAMSGVMLGNHAISLLTDAWMKGVRSFDPEKALEAYLHEATNKGPYGGSNGREGWEDYFTKGYVPYGGKVHETTAKTLEYAYNDFCGYQLAKAIGNDYYANIFKRQMFNYRHVWDSKVGFMRGRLADGSWRPDFDPIEWGGPFTEGNSWQYTWSVFHDLGALGNMLGGADKFVAKLDTFFTMHSDFKVGSYGTEIHEMTEMVLANMGQYAHGNQPVQHVAYAYNYAGEPWKTQERVRKIMSQLYNATPKGFPGDEDQGGMSSWYVLSALGLYSVCPGTTEYNIGSPVFEKATIHLENGKKFVIEAENNSAANVYIESASINGKSLDKNYIDIQDILEGGTLKYKMSNRPNTNRGRTKEASPFTIHEMKP
ncbi:alpha-1 2-mannosidase [Sphingobacterium griseoflavum]|uniref:Alpha-1 2-mannosidase n=2 Tax=Sphingobacterium griseoflavum TaxID=1474952 RepID=A0ABQ3HY23_9SPHI|nr:alpha-1 2-mannosidase [Sphingobacterium griseoflavum]